MKCVFQTLLDATRTKHVGYINGDIIIFRDFLDTLVAIERDHDRFFMVGRRETLAARKKRFLTYTESEWGKLESEACKSPIDGAGAIDYSPYPRVTPSTCAIFLHSSSEIEVGQRRGWHSHRLLMNLPVIDVTKTAIALHQGRESPSPRRTPGERTITDWLFDSWGKRTDAARLNMQSTSHATERVETVCWYAQREPSQRGCVNIERLKWCPSCDKNLLHRKLFLLIK